MHFASFLLIARALDPATFGVVALASLFIALLAVLVEQGFTQALVQRESIEDAHLDTAFWTNLGLSAAFAVALVFAAGSLATAFTEPDLAPVLQVLSFSVILGAFCGVQAAILQRGMRFGALASRSFLGTLAGGIVGVALALTDYGVWALVGQRLIAQALTAIGLWNATGWRPRTRFSLDRLKELWGFGLNVLGSKLVGFVNTKTTSVAIAILLDKRSLGLYTVADQVERTFSSLLIHTITRVSLPTLSRLQGDLPAFRRVYFSGVRLTAAVAVPAFVGVAVLAPEISTSILGPQWIDAAPVMSILALLGVVKSVGAFNITAITSLGHPKRNFQLDALNALITVAAVVVASPWGLIGVSVAFVARAYLLWSLRFWVLRRLCGATFRELGAALWAILASTTIMAASVTFLRRFDVLGPLLELAALVLAGVLVYTLGLAILAPATLREGLSFGRATLTRAA